MIISKESDGVWISRREMAKLRKTRVQIQPRLRIYMRIYREDDFRTLIYAAYTRGTIIHIIPVVIFDAAHIRMIMSDAKFSRRAFTTGQCRMLHVVRSILKSLEEPAS